MRADKWVLGIGCWGLGCAAIAQQPVSVVLIDASTLMDEREGLGLHMPGADASLSLRDRPEEDYEDFSAICKGFEDGARTMEEVIGASGLSELRARVAVAKLVKSGCVTCDSSSCGLRGHFT